MKYIAIILAALYIMSSKAVSADASNKVGINPVTIRIGAKVKGRADSMFYNYNIGMGQISYYWELQDSTSKALETGNVYTPITWQQMDSTWILNNIANELGVTIKP